MPNTWVTLDGQPMARTAAMDDSAWRALLLSQGWTPGASSPNSGSPAALNPAQALALLFEGLRQGVTFVSAVHGAINGVDPGTGLVNTASGPVPPGQLGAVTGTGGAAGTDVNFVPEEEEGFLDKPMNLALIGGGLLVLLLVLKK